MLYSIIIPVFKSTNSLEILAEDFSMLQKEKGYQLELIFVNDSPFYLETNKVLQKLDVKYENVKYISLRKNQGQHMALLVGISKAKGDYIITMDDDLQHPVKEIPKLINAIQSNSAIEAIFAVPEYNKKKHNLWRNLGSFIVNRIDVMFLNKPKGLVKSSFKIFTKDLATIVLLNFNASPSLSSLIIDSTSNIQNLIIEHDKREFGKSNYTLSKLISLTLNNLLHYSSLPLKLIGLLGVVGLIFAFLFIAFTLYKKLFHGIDFPGYASTITLISFFGGLNLFASGIIGEYLIRIIKEQQKKELKNLIK